MVIDIEPLLRNYDIIEVTRYLAKRDALLASEIVEVHHLKTKPNIIDYLNMVLQTIDPGRTKRILSAVSDFSANTYAENQRIITALKQQIKRQTQKSVSKKQEKTAREKISPQRCQELPSSSSSSSSNEDLTLCFSSQNAS